MVRTQKNSIDEEKLRQEIKRELEDDFKKRFEKKKHNRGRKKTCCGCVLAIILVLCGLIVYFFQTGTTKIPFVGQIWYKQNVPTRWVDIDEKTPAGRLGDIFEDQIEESIGKKISNVHDIIDLFPNDQKAIVNISLSENELTNLIQSSITDDGDIGANQQTIRINYIQAVIEEEFIELFFVLEEPLNIRVRVRFIPTIKEGNLDIEILELVVGKVFVPPFIHKAMYNKFIAPELSLISKTLSEMLPKEIKLSHANILLQEIDLLGFVRFSQDDTPKPKAIIDFEAFNIDEFFESY